VAPQGLEPRTLRV